MFSPDMLFVRYERQCGKSLENQYKHLKIKGTPTETEGVGVKAAQPCL